MKKIVLLFLCHLSLLSAQSQPRDGANHPKEIVMMSRQFTGSLLFGNQRVDKFKELDRTVLTATYRMRFVQDTLKRDTLVDQLVLQIGTTFSKCYSQRTFLDDQSYTDYETGKTDRDKGYGIEGTTYIDYDMIFNATRRTITTIHRMPFEDEYTRSYDEPMPTFEWSYLHDQDSICGYVCHAAQAAYAGRVWRVWYTTDIPLNNGPWKLAGLPGLILKAVDSTGAYEFLCEGLNSTPTPIVSYQWRTKRITKAEWRRFECRAYDTPMNIFSEGGTKQFLSFDPQTKKFTEIPSDWKIPYNPLELE